MACIPRPVLTAERPSQTIAQMGPLSMSFVGLVSDQIKLRRPLLTGDQPLVERFIRQVLIMLLQVLLGRCDEFHGNELISD